jgi:DNA-binding transcriptional regulator YbjK
MRANPERRALIADTALAILAGDGAGGLTHRTVDTRAGLPQGTTSNFFRTRIALLQAAAERMAEVHWDQVAKIRAELGGPTGRAGAARLLARVLDPADETMRQRNLARFELYLEANRQAELRPIMADIYTAAMEAAGAVLTGCGLDPAPEQLRRFSRLLNGIAFDHLTLPVGPIPQAELARLIESLMDVAF